MSIFSVANTDLIFKKRRTAGSLLCAISLLQAASTQCPALGQADRFGSKVAGTQSKSAAAVPLPPPINAIVNSGLESGDTEFLLPFQGKIEAQAPGSGTGERDKQASGSKDQGGETGTQTTMVSRVVPNDISYGSSETATDVSPNSWPGRGQARSSLAPLPASVRPGDKRVCLRLFGSVSREDQFGVRIDDLLAAALVRNTKLKDINRTVAHFHSRRSKAFDGFKDSMDEALDYKGTSRSMEAADIILDKAVKAGSSDSADYMKQRYVDQLHPKIVAKVMQIAMGIGTADQVRAKQLVESGLKGLTQLVGDRQAKNTLGMLRDWFEHISVSDEVFNQQPWDVETHQNKVMLATKIAMNSDPVVENIIQSVRKFDRSSFANRTYGAANAVANATEVVAPGLAIPFAVEVVRVGMVQANGGSEPKKLLRELYYDKRIESRYRTINEEAQLAITNYQLALAGRNPTLLACAESVLSQLVGVDSIGDVLDKSIFHPRGNQQHDESRAVAEAETKAPAR